MTISRAEVKHWRDTITEDEWTPKYDLDQLAKHNSARFAELTHALLRDPSPKVQRVALQKLWERGESDTSVQEACRLATTTDEELKSVVFEVLRSAASPAALPTLFTLAEAGSPDALWLAYQLAQTGDEQKRVHHLAQQYVFAQDDDLRRTSIGIVATQLSLSKWEDLQIELARRYGDEDAIEALGHRGTSRVLPALRGLLDEIGPGYTESEAVALAIEQIQQREASLPQDTE